MTPSPRCTGLFLPIEIMEMEELSLLDTLLLSWIDALYCPKVGGCFASNEYLGHRCKGAKENTIAKALTKLRKLGLIEDVSFDGRRRVIRACIGKQVEKVQSKADLDKNPTRVGQKSNADLDKNPSSPIIYNKEDSKGKNIAQSRASHGREQRPDFSFSSTSGKFENISDQDLSSWRSAYPDIDISQEIIKAQQWLLANPSKAKKKLWRKFLVGWFTRANEKAENKKAYRSQAGGHTADRRTRNVDGTPVESPADGLF